MKHKKNEGRKTEMKNKSCITIGKEHAGVRIHTYELYQGLDAAKQLLAMLRNHVKSGAVHWDPAIDFSDGKRREFTLPQYIDFAKRALDESIQFFRWIEENKTGWIEQKKVNRSKLSLNE